MSPVISESELHKVKSKQGLYSTLRKEPARDHLIESMEKVLRPLIIKIVERAFKTYAKAHKAPAAQIELEWHRFKKYLDREL